MDLNKKDLNVKVTKEIIDGSKPGDPCACMINKAVEQHFGGPSLFYHMQTGYDERGLGTIWVNGQKLFLIPAETTIKMRAYDGGAPVEPFNFTLIRR
jgi:hypothetical protein